MIEDLANLAKPLPLHLPKAEPPTVEELYESAQRHLKLAAPTYLENWPDDLRRLSIAQVGLPLTEPQQLALMTIPDGPEKLEQNSAALWQVIDWIEGQLPAFPNGVYVKLGSRSPKDAYLPFDDDGFRIRSGKKAVVLLVDSSRVVEDLTLARNGRYQPWVFLREWKDIPTWSEFRCFMHNRELTGISQYFYREAFPEIAKYKTTIEWGIQRFFDRLFRPAIHLDSVVFDVFIQIKDKQSSTAIEVKLLEINPYCPMTDPCLYAWHRPEDFKGELRYREERP